MTTTHRPIHIHADSCWPDADQACLLKACLLEGEAALRPWEKWREAVLLDYIDAPSFKLIPLLYRNLVTQGAPSEDLAQIKGLYRYHWVRHQLQVRVLKELYELFQRHGIPVMAIKGSALILDTYPDPATRVRGDLDLMVHESDAPRAFQVIEAAGWKPHFQNHEDLLRFGHASTFEQGHPTPQLDLHWHLFYSDCRKGEDEDYWETARQVELDGLPVMVLSREDQLLHACEHGMRYDVTKPIRAFCDIVMILRAAGADFNWSAFVERAIRKEQVLASAKILRYAKDHFGAPVPEKILAELAACEGSTLERLEHFFTQIPTPAGSNFWNLLPIHLISYYRQKRPTGFENFFKDLSRFLQVMTNLPEPPLAHISRDLDRRMRIWDFEADLRKKLRQTRGQRGYEIFSIANLSVLPSNGLHQLELHQDSPIRWTVTDLLLLLDLEPGDYQFRVEVPFITEKIALNPRSLKITWNGENVKSLRVASNLISFDLRRKHFAKGRQQRLALQCPRTECPGDPRHLGLPLKALVAVKRESKPAG